jgi:hypothetical protein
VPGLTSRSNWAGHQLLLLLLLGQADTVPVLLLLLPAGAREDGSECSRPTSTAERCLDAQVRAVGQ